MRYLFVFLFSASFLFSSGIKEGNFIEDDEMEFVFKEYFKKIYKVANLNNKDIRVFFINDNEINASASIKNTYFINTGLILKSDSVGEVLGVLSHEVSHVSSRHVERRLGAYSKVGRASLAMAALGLIGGIVTGSPELTLMVFGGSLGTGLKNVSNYSQGQEDSADQGAMKYAEKLGWSLKGLYKLLSKVKMSDYLSDKYLSPYVRTHPLTSDRLSTLKNHIEKSKNSDNSFDEELIKSYKRIKYKVEAYTIPPVQTLNKYNKKNDPDSIYAKSIAYLRSNNYKEAHEEIDDLIRKFPNDIYYKELK